MNQMDESKLSISAETKQQSDPVPSTTEVRRAALKNLALCAAWGAISGVLWATGVVSVILHSGYFREKSESAGIEFAKMVTFNVCLVAVTGWAIVAMLLGFVLLTRKWPRSYDQIMPFLPSGQPDPRLVRRAAAKNLWFCLLWSLGAYGLSTTPLPSQMGDFFLEIGHGSGGIWVWIIGHLGPLFALLLIFGWMLALPFVLMSLVTGGWLRFMKGWLPFSPKAEPLKEELPTETSENENK